MGSLVQMSLLKIKVADLSHVLSNNRELQMVSFEENKSSFNSTVNRRVVFINSSLTGALLFHLSLFLVLLSNMSNYLLYQNSGIL